MRKKKVNFVEELFMCMCVCKLDSIFLFGKIPSVLIRH